MELNSSLILTQVFHQNCKELHLDDDNTRFIKWASDTIEMTYLYVISLSETSQIVVEWRRNTMQSLKSRRPLSNQVKI